MSLEATISVGDVTVIPIVESALWCPIDVWIGELDAEAAITATREWCDVTVGDDGWVVAPVRCYVVQSAGRTILVDSGQGEVSPFGTAIPGWRADLGDLAADMAAAGIDPAQVDQVVMTHAHPDHTGWNMRSIDGSLEPTFPNARYLLCEPDWVLTEQFGDLAAPLVTLREGGLLDLVAADTTLTAEVRLIESHGHTPGHVCVEINSGGEQALIIGDVIHHKVSLANPDGRESLDNDEALATRQALYTRLADSATLILASHFEAPAAGYLKSRGAGYEFSATR